MILFLEQRRKKTPICGVVICWSQVVGALVMTVATLFCAYCCWALGRGASATPKKVLAGSAGFRGGRESFPAELQLAVGT